MRVGNKTLFQRNPPVLNWGFQLTQVVLYNGCKTVAAAATAAAAAVAVAVGAAAVVSWLKLKRSRLVN